MPIAVEVELDPRELDRVERSLSAIPRAMPRVVKRALNRTGKASEGHIVKRIATVLPMTQRDIRKGMWRKRATLRRWQYKIGLSSRPTPLIRLGPAKTAKGITYRQPGGGRALARRAFKARMPGGHIGIFRRRSMPGTHGSLDDLVGRLKIDELYTDSISQAFEDTPMMRQGIIVNAEQRLVKELHSGVDWELVKAAKK